MEDTDDMADVVQQTFELSLNMEEDLSEVETKVEKEVGA